MIIITICLIFYVGGLVAQTYSGPPGPPGNIFCCDLLHLYIEIFTHYRNNVSYHTCKTHRIIKTIVNAHG